MFASFVEQEFVSLRRFLVAPGQVLRRVLIDGEMRPLFLRVLAGHDEREDFPHLLIAHRAPFQDPASWFAGLDAALASQMLDHAAALSGLGLTLEDEDAGREITAPWRFLRRAERFAAALPDHAGALAFLFEPEAVGDRDGFRRSMEFLAHRTRETWLKFILLEDRQSPWLPALAGPEPRITTRVFWLAPEELARRLEAAAPPPGAAEAIAHPALAAAFARSQGDLGGAEALGRGEFTRAEAEGDPGRRAAAAHELGRTLLAAGRPDEAVAALIRACDLCAEHGLSQRAPAAYADLAVGLHRLGQAAEAFQALKVANRFHHAAGNVPGEAETCDRLAALHEEAGRRAEAARIWRYALRLYESITNPALADVAAAGRADILVKLGRVEQRHAAE